LIHPRLPLITLADHIAQWSEVMIPHDPLSELVRLESDVNKLFTRTFAYKREQRHEDGKRIVHPPIARIDFAAFLHRHTHLCESGPVRSDRIATAQ
jgi:hypothetical protein